MDTIILASQPTGFEISNALLIVVSLLIPAIVFLVGLFRNESEVNGPLARVVSHAPASFGRSLGLQAIAICIVVFAINMIYILFSEIFPGVISPSIEFTAIVSGIGILVVVLFLFVIVYSLSNTNSLGTSVIDGKSIAEQAEEETNTMILQQRNNELRERLSKQGRQIADMTTAFKRLQISMKNNDDIPDDMLELAEMLTEEDNQSSREWKTRSDDDIEEETETN